jgi:SRSO17 transposase
LERKNGWTLAEMSGDKGPERLQRLLNFYAWDTDGIRDDVRAMVAESIGDTEQGVLILDDTGFLKKGVKSAWVARQYSGTAGRIGNCQIGVFCMRAREGGR